MFHCDVVSTVAIIATGVAFGQRIFLEKSGLMFLFAQLGAGSRFNLPQPWGFDIAPPRQRVGAIDIQSYRETVL